MKLPSPIKVLDLAKQLAPNKIIGNQAFEIIGINEIHKVVAGDLTFVDVAKYYQKALNSAASVILINQAITPPIGKTLIVLAEPFEAYNKLVRQYRPFRPLNAHLSETSLIHPSTILEPNVIIGNHVKIGKNCYIQANVTIRDYTIIGDNVIIQSNTVIGGDAFYFIRRDGADLLYDKLENTGRTIIEDHVGKGPKKIS